MKKYVVYLEENAIKAGCTTSKRYPKRMKEQGIKSDILFDTDDIFMASMFERMAQIFHGCPLDQNYYHTHQNEEVKLKRDQYYKKTIEKRSLKQKESLRQLALDPIRVKNRSENIKQSHIVFNMDPDKVLAKSKKLSKAALGRKHSAENLVKFSESKMGALNPRHLVVEIHGILYESMEQASKSLSCNPATIGNRCRSEKFPEYKFIDKNPDKYKHKGKQ